VGHDPRFSFDFKKMRPTILFLTTYRLFNPTGGGQLRSLALLKAYKAAGFKTLSMAIYLAEGGNPYKEYPLDVPFPADHQFRMIDGRSDLELSDLLAGRWAANAGFTQVRDRISGEISAIHAEQAYVYPIAARLRDEVSSCKDAILINGSENIEWQMKGEILSKKGLPSSFIELVESDIRDLEVEAARNCNVSLAVTETDAEWIRSTGASVVIHAKNGVQPYSDVGERALQWKEQLPRLPWCFYAASAHPPNCTGFVNTLGGYFGYIPPGRKIVVAGGVCTLLRSAYDSLPGVGLRSSRLELLGEVDVKDLNAIKSLTLLYVLPITEGGGSNLKTAEALYSRKKVITTRKGMRGFEDYLGLSSVLLAESPDDFRNILSIALSDATLSQTMLTHAEVESLTLLTWDQCLKSAVTYIYNLVRGG
jgi:hypothetical protein